MQSSLISAAKLPRVDRAADKSFKSMEPLEEVIYLGNIREWKAASAQLASSIQTYFNACLALSTARFDPLRVFANAPPVSQTLASLEDNLRRLDLNIQKLQRAKATLCLARNRSTKLAPINLLPRELLSHIFELVVISEFWGVCLSNGQNVEDSTDDKSEVPKQHYTLSRVCVYWQQVIASTPSLWSRINLAVSGRHRRTFYARAARIVPRTIKTPLTIRIHEPIPSKQSDINRLAKWLAIVAKRIYSLDVPAGITSTIVNSVLSSWLTNGTPGTVKELTLVVPPGFNNFIKATRGSNAVWWSYDLSPEKLEDFFRPIAMLRLTRLFPSWESHAYHGLTHLQLSGGRITEVQLAAIFSSSPQLRVLSLRLTFTTINQDDAPKTPVSLR
ncbi:hypothetical protein FRC07_007349 [Ceratobasidium sp. 392]|nr:hypothetical protein FRC07_007349 [Ceratobasidium sp. 392]